MPCHSASCASCYHVDPGLFFLLIKPFGNEYIYYRRSRKDESRYLVARKGNCILAPHQCKKYSFMILCWRCLDRGSLAYRQTLAVIHRANLYIFWNRDNSMIHGMLGYKKGTGGQIHGSSQSSTIACHHSLTCGWWSGYGGGDLYAGEIFVKREQRQELSSV